MKFLNLNFVLAGRDKTLAWRWELENWSDELLEKARVELARIMQVSEMKCWNEIFEETIKDHVPWRYSGWNSAWKNVQLYIFISAEETIENKWHL